MKPPRCLVPTLLVATFLLAGCTRTYRVSTTVPGRHSLTVRADGAAPFVMVSNDGPGVLAVTFDDGHRQDGPREVRPGSETGRTLHGAREVILSTSDAPAEVRIEASRAEGLAIGSMTPR